MSTSISKIPRSPREHFDTWDTCRGCGLYETIQEDGFCVSCSAELYKCQVCNDVYTTSNGYEDTLQCPECNHYYRQKKSMIGEIYQLKNDILSFMGKIALANCDLQEIKDMLKSAVLRLAAIQSKYRR